MCSDGDLLYDAVGDVHLVGLHRLAADVLVVLPVLQGERKEMACGRGSLQQLFVTGKRKQSELIIRYTTHLAWLIQRSWDSPQSCNQISLPSKAGCWGLCKEPVRSMKHSSFLCCISLYLLLLPTFKS